jgi:lipid A 4'-phosphatase
VSIVDTKPEENRPAFANISTICIASAAGLFAALLFSAFPEIDLAVSRLFYLGDGTFLFSQPSVGAVIRTLLRVGFALACIASVAGFISLAFFGRKFLGLGMLAWAYIGLCAAVGPGLVANLGFKDYWGRARPVHIEEFGGPKTFTPPLLRTDQCESNCAFISGEASNYYMLGFAFASLAAGQGRRRQFFLAAIAAGTFSGLIRIGGGGHFLSDVVFAGIFMAFVARGLEWLMLDRPDVRAFLADGSAFHERMLRTGRRINALILRLWRRIIQG